MVFYLQLTFNYWAIPGHQTHDFPCKPRFDLLAHNKTIFSIFHGENAVCLEPTTPRIYCFPFNRLPRGFSPNRWLKPLAWMYKKGMFVIIILHERGRALAKWPMYSKNTWTGSYREREASSHVEVFLRPWCGHGFDRLDLELAWFVTMHSLVPPVPNQSRPWCWTALMV